MLKIKDGSGKDTVFVLGNTNLFENLSQKELEVLHKNGDRRVISEPAKEEKKESSEKSGKS